MPKLILFVCGHNAGRSQMAEAYFNHINTNPHYRALSCGTHPSEKINPVVEKILKEEGIITENLFPKLITSQMQKDAEKIFTMGCGVECSVFLGEREVIDWNLPDPNGKGEKMVREVFQKIKEYTDDLGETLSL